MNKRRTREKDIYEDQQQRQGSDRDKKAKAVDVDSNRAGLGTAAHHREQDGEIDERMLRLERLFRLTSAPDPATVRPMKVTVLRSAALRLPRAFP